MSKSSLSKSSLWLAGTLALAVGCADVDPAGDADNGTIESGADAPLTVIRVSEGRRIEFYPIGNGVMVSQRYKVGEEPILSAADKQLSAPELYRRYAPPNSEIPDALYGKAEPTEGDLPESVSIVGSNAAGGGQRVPEAETGDLARVTGALSLGEGCHPTQSNVVLADCRNNWYGGYFADAAPTWFFDDRVQALHGSLDARTTHRSKGQTLTRTTHVAQGEVVNDHWTQGRYCKTVLGFPVDCWDVKVARRLDVLNASKTTFNVDIVAFN
jgi:hypothetical protein